MRKRGGGGRESEDPSGEEEKEKCGQQTRGDVRAERSEGKSEAKE